METFTQAIEAAAEKAKSTGPGTGNAGNSAK